MKTNLYYTINDFKIYKETDLHAAIRIKWH